MGFLKAFPYFCTFETTIPSASTHILSELSFLPVMPQLRWDVVSGCAPSKAGVSFLSCSESESHQDFCRQKRKALDFRLDVTLSVTTLLSVCTVFSELHLCNCSGFVSTFPTASDILLGNLPFLLISFICTALVFVLCAFPIAGYFQLLHG